MNIRNVHRLQVQLLALEEQLAVTTGEDIGSVPPRKPVRPSAPPLNTLDGTKPAAAKKAA